MYEYMTLGDGTEIVHSQILEDNKIIVNFERPTENGFDNARCELPSYKWISINGYSDEEIALFNSIIERNAHLIYKYAKEGGVKFA